MPEDELKNKVLEYIGSKGLLASLQKLYVGFSGGPDSTALLILMNDLYHQVNAVHFNHGLRGDDADSDEKWCREFCDSRSIPFETVKLDVKKNRRKRESIEMTGRRLRLAYWTKRLSGHDDSVLLLAHHIDDKIENFFIRLIRGSNASGLTGLRSSSIIDGIKIIRPFLCVEKQEIINFLHKQNIRDYCIDKSNTDLHHKRNRIRHQLLPEIIRIAGNKRGLLNSLEYLENDATELDNRLDDKSLEIARELAIDTLLQLSRSHWPRILRQWVCRNTGDENPIKGKVLKNLYDNLSCTQPHGSTFDLNEHHVIRIDHGTLILEKRNQPTLSSQLSWNWQKSAEFHISDLDITLSAEIVDANHLDTFDEQNCEFLDPNAINSVFTIRTWSAGDNITPFGSKDRVKVKKLIANAKLSIEDKRSLILICDQNTEILWIPLVRRADLARVNSFDQDVLKLSYRRIQR